MRVASVVLILSAVVPRQPAPATPRHALDVDYARSHIVAKLKKAGFLRFLGHEHGVTPATWSAEVVFDEQDLEASRISVDVDAPELIIDTPRARELAEVDPDGPSDSEREEIRAKMLSDEQLDVARFPTIRFESTRMRLRRGGGLRIDGALTLHGVSRPVEVETDLVIADGSYVVSGRFEIALRDFDIEPVSIGGVVKVANEVEISFRIYAAQSGPSRGMR